MNFEWISKLISQRFGTHFGVHFRILGESREGLGSWGLASSDFDRFWIDLRPSWEASWGHVGAHVGLMLASFFVMIF